MVCRFIRKIGGSTMNTKKLKVGDKFRILKKYEAKYEEWGSEGLEYNKTYTVTGVSSNTLSVFYGDSSWYQLEYVQPLSTLKPKYVN